MSNRSPIFRLNRVLRHREEVERTHQRELATALADLDAQQRVLGAAVHRHEAALDRMRSALGSSRIGAAELMALQSESAVSHVEQQRAAEATSHRAQCADERRHALVGARQAREVIERLMSRRMARLEYEKMRREQAQMDEFAHVSLRAEKASTTPLSHAYTPSTQTSEDVLM